MKQRPSGRFARPLCAVLLASTIVLWLGNCGPTSLPEPTTIPIAAPTPIPKEVILTMGSWRPDDVEQMNRILVEFHELHPDIVIRFDPTSAPDYDAALEAQLAGGTAPDLFYLRSFTKARQLYEAGYLEPLNDLPGLRENFTVDTLSPWATDNGDPYGVPFIATSHGIYYNADLFEQLNLQVPTTWESLLTTARTIQEMGFIPFANASGDSWTMAEIVFMNLAPNFIGGREGRLAYLDGERCFDDDHMVAAFQSVADLAPFLPKDHHLLTYYESQQLFLQGRAAMWLGGSWDIPFFELENPGFAWSVFAPPSPAGQPGYLTFHLDAGMGLNTASAHQAEAREFLVWMTTPEFGALLGDELPGFFPMHSRVPPLQNEHANSFLALNEGRGTDVRLAWEKLRDGSPDGYTLMLEGAVAVANGAQTPQQAAGALQAGLAQWFEPAKTCRK